MVENVKVKKSHKSSSKKNNLTQQKPRHGENVIKGILFLFALVSIFTTIGIVTILLKETVGFFKEVSILEFLTGTEWTALFANPKFGVLPLVSGTLMIAFYGSVVAIPTGLGCAIYLSEYASKRTRKIIKPVLEILAGIPSIVYGYFALTFITPIIRKFVPDTMVFNALSASITVGIMIIPMVSSLSEDAMKAVPDSLRHGAYALGCTKFEVATKVVVPAALSSIIASFVLAISRAIGETMIVTLAAGSTPNLTLNPLESIQTMTAFIVQVAKGDVEHGGLIYKTIFAVGMLLFVITLAMNILAKLIIKKFREEY
ncbi:phosphate ABC transporter permease subunit PstC [Thermohalobacter berrensis]|uniref:Phosphate transport system permease protein n=1 Tax=Thermohalobacter berrensis TaxID=99594 RepID=A0A419T9X1_9FIRM|nr:phosphate ABC transporter permease subunit PstC [Thermohalobacter berrensis]RKD34284.1 phosphate ABC transporter permease subunit PstC [Thermohalobacter berrensis]